MWQDQSLSEGIDHEESNVTSRRLLNLIMKATRQASLGLSVGMMEGCGIYVLTMGGLRSYKADLLISG
jgi:hypothetical protein